MTYATIDIDMNEFNDETLINELESRGYMVVSEPSEIDELKDDIFALYKEWLSDQGDRDNRFEKAMRNFFEKHLNKVSV